MPVMLRAEKAGLLSRDYEITVDGQPVALFHRSGWRTGGRITWNGAEFALSHRGWGKVFTLTAPDGQVVAEANGVGRRNWSMRVEGREYPFRRTSLFMKDIALMYGDQQAGTIARIGGVRGGAEADLPGLSVLAQVFAVSAVLAEWEAQRRRRSSAAASSGGGGGGG